ncbi:F-box/LRR-repeat protein At3g26922-like [Ananas comosus]|uniref:F-box/LRR-repeat protein At3g26922-like n=1 Tax=Ananas comosus TaxID=4615 RepID=A0A6P5EQW4_ANACO|nr:F-box/LRR-repeat protein At3g26922-like [Ananas comosus]
MDTVSALPDRVLEKIVSLLPLNDMLRTSLLSRRWRRVWTTVLAFDFTDAADDDVNVYISRIDSCLEHLSASPSCVTIPSIVFPAIQDSDVVDRWIRFAAAHSVQRLQLAMWMDYTPPIPFTLPLSLFQLCRGLTALDISSCEIPAVLEPAISPAFPSLRSLSLFEVTIANPLAFFAQCPAIERLTAELLDEDDLLPASAFRSCPLLSTLSLARCTVPREHPSAGPPAFPSLRALELDNVSVAAPQSLLNSCSVIAELTIKDPPEGFAFRLDPRHTVSTLRISSPTVLPLSLPSSSLRTLVLSDLEIANPQALIRAFQGLELLSFESVWSETGADSGIQVRAPRMRHLMVQDSEELGTVIVADTPQLCGLFYWGDIRYLGVFDHAIPKLEEAFLHCMVKNPYGGKYHLWKNLMQPLSHVRLLSVNWWFICEFMQGCPVGSERLTFDKLEEFHWWPVFKKYAAAPFGKWYTKRLSPIIVLSLLDFLECCPNIQHLCIVVCAAIAFASCCFPRSVS